MGLRFDMTKTFMIVYGSSGPTPDGFLRQDADFCTRGHESKPAKTV